jgi:hypothetical protein
METIGDNESARNLHDKAAAPDAAQRPFPRIETDVGVSWQRSATAVAPSLPRCIQAMKCEFGRAAEFRCRLSAGRLSAAG